MYLVRQGDRYLAWALVQLVCCSLSSFRCTVFLPSYWKHGIDWTNDSAPRSMACQRPRSFAKQGSLTTSASKAFPASPVSAGDESAMTTDSPGSTCPWVKDHPGRMTILPLNQIVRIMYRHCMEKADGLVTVKFNHRVINVGQHADVS